MMNNHNAPRPAEQAQALACALHTRCPFSLPCLLGHIWTDWAHLKLLLARNNVAPVHRQTNAPKHNHQRFQGITA